MAWNSRLSALAVTIVLRVRGANGADFRKRACTSAGACAAESRHRRPRPPGDFGGRGRCHPGAGAHPETPSGNQTAKGPRRIRAEASIPSLLSVLEVQKVQQVEMIVDAGTDDIGVIRRAEWRRPEHDIAAEIVVKVFDLGRPVAPEHRFHTHACGPTRARLLTADPRRAGAHKQPHAAESGTTRSVQKPAVEVPARPHPLGRQPLRVGFTAGAGPQLMSWLLPVLPLMWAQSKSLSKPSTTWPACQLPP